MPSMAWWTPSPFRWQSRRIFRVFIRAKACSTRARTSRWEVLCTSFHAGSSLWPRSRWCGMTRPVPRQPPSTISTVSSRNRLRCCSASAGPRWLTIRSAADFDTPNSGLELAQRQVQQDPVLQRQAPEEALADRVRALASQCCEELAELTRTQPRERGYPRRLRHAITAATPRSSNL
jgi:hypothetical protein